MLAVIEKEENGFIAKFERHMKHPLEEVWSYLTDNDKLPKWFPELRVEDLRDGGIIKFNLQDGNFIDMKIIDYKMFSVLELTWGEDSVRFELEQEADGCILILIEKLNKITAHTPKDLAGWHVCLDVISAVLDGRTIESRTDEWKKWFEKYTKAINEITAH